MSTKTKEQKQELHLVLVGMSGSGRSATGNTILGEKWFEAVTSDQSVTTACQTETKTINGIEITVTDTPGLYCTRLPEEDVIKQLKDLTCNLKRPYAYLLVIRVGPVTMQHIETMSKLEQALGESFLSRTVIAFSHSDDLESQTEEEFIQEGGKEFKDLIEKHSTPYHFFNNRSERLAPEEMEELICSTMKIATKNETYPQQPRMQHTTGHRDSFEDFKNCSKGSEKTKKFETTQQHGSESQGQDCTNIMVLGLKGSGKSSSIKNILKSSHEEYDGCEEFTGERLEMKMHLFECPGFSNQDEIEPSINKGLRGCAPGPHVIMIVLNVDHLSPDTEQMMKCVLDILKPEARKHVMILFTRNGDLEDKHIEKIISDSEDFKTLVSLCDNRYCTLASGDKNASQVRRLIVMFDEILHTSGRFSSDHCIAQQQSHTECGPSGVHDRGRTEA